MDFNNTTTRAGIIQAIERWTGYGDGGISGDSTLLKIFTAEVNESFDELMPHILRYLRANGWDDSNQSGTPIKRQNLVSGTSVYTFATDDNSVPVIGISSVLILPTATATEYIELEQIDAEDDDAPFYITPNSLQTGSPTKCLIQGTKVYFNVTPNYSATNGVKAVVSRQQYRYVSSDTTKQAALPLPFHPLLAYLTAQRWLSRNKEPNAELEKLIKTQTAQLKGFIGALFPSNEKGRTKGVSFI